MERIKSQNPREHSPIANSNHPSQPRALGFPAQSDPLPYLQTTPRAEPQRRRSVLAGFQQQVPMILSRFHLPPPGVSDPAGACLQASRLGLCAARWLALCLLAPLRCNVTLQGAAASCWEPKESIHIPIRGIWIPSCEIQNPCAAKESITMTNTASLIALLHTLGK